MLHKIQTVAFGIVAAVATLLVANCSGELAMQPAMGAATHHATTYGPAHTQRMGVPTWMTRPCKTEDSVNCYWNAQRMGNGLGRSFYARLMPHTHGLVCITYVKTADAHVSDQCYRAR